MSDKTGIEWTDATWNAVTGCTKVSAGCDHCYAETIATRFAGTKAYPDGFEVTLRPERLDQPLRWKRPRRIFVNSMSDLFHKDVPDEFIAQIFAVMALAQQHTFQVLTKRPGRMRSLLLSDRFVEMIDESRPESFEALGWPLPNVWLGTSVENQHWADVRIPLLLETPAAVRFLSCEPLLGPVDLTRYLWLTGGSTAGPFRDYAGRVRGRGGIGGQTITHVAARDLHWVIVGGESGAGARPMHPDWARSLRDQCVEAGVPFHFKQRGEWTWNESGSFTVPQQPFSTRTAVMHPAGMTAMTKGNLFDPFKVGHPNWATRINRVGKKAAGRELDGRTWDEYPAMTS